MRVVRTSLFALVLSLVAVQGFAEVRFYIVPKIGTGATIEDAFRPKYIFELGVESGAMDYGREDTMLVGADVTPAQHAILAAETDVISIPQALDSNVSASALSTVQTKIEGLKVPANWVTTSHSYREVVQIVGKIFLLMQRFDGLHQRTFFDLGITLDTRINQLTAGQRNNLQDAAASLGLETAFVTGPMTLRSVLRTWALAMPSFTLQGETF